ncbi:MULTISPECIES: MFS transporter [unclassified Acinetobacter]|uniref:MFS transporter n=1 Tax=unclassified Acinetobacter TaxID=196816 RepID=UPI002934FE93|nr:MULTISPECIES: MFS transporter [unclassified Acinetobacter]WOE30861.1 MFS transporter [Acinetobacter sp. SAAs470]WOE39056.1 MFS transporter [Acinetobacter sp. SAAs474]
MTSNTVSVNDVINKATFKPFHLKIILWCLFIVLFDGYDLAINGVVLPLLMQEWNMTAVEAGMLASTALAGMMFGAMSFGMLADRIGRKKVIMICVTLFSGFTFWGGFASNPTEFAVLRFIAGLGIGGVLPNLVALTSEYAPQRLKSTLVTTMFSGYAVGGIMAALCGSWFTASFGWQIMFYIAGIPLIFLPLFWKFVPESLTYLVKEQKLKDARHFLQKVEPTIQLKADTQLVLSSTDQTQTASVKALFTENRAGGTVLFWVAFFMCLLMLYALGSWLPKLMMAAGYSLGSSLMFLLALNIGAVIGTIGGGILADRFDFKPVLISMLTVGVLSLVGLGFNSPQPVIYLLVGLAGASSIGSSILLYSYVAQYYPVAVRSTGIGWASAVGRTGAIVGPIVIGMLLGMELPHKWNFIAVALPGIVGAFAIAFIRVPQTSPVLSKQLKAAKI